MSDATSCFASLKPSLDEVVRLVFEAPIDNRQRAGLATMCAAHLLGAAAGAMQQASPQARRRDAT